MSQLYRLFTPLFLFSLAISTFCPLQASPPAKAKAVPKTKLAFLADFSGTLSSHVLTDLNLEKGARIFSFVHPEFDKAIEMVKIDNEGDPKYIPHQMEQIAGKKIQFIVGLSKTSQALVAAPLSDKYGVLMITPMATNDKITPGHDLVARSCFSDKQQGSTLAKFALSELKAKRILVMTNVDTPYSVGLSQTMRSEVEKAVEEKAQIRELKYSSEDIQTQKLQKEIAEFNPDLVFIPDYVNTASLLIKEIYRINPHLTLLGGDGWGGREVLDPTIKGMTSLRAFYTTVWNEGLSTPENKIFVQAHQKVFPGESISIGAACMYDALTVFWNAYRRANLKTPLNVKKQLLAQDFKTTTGSIRFADARDLTPSRKVVIIRLNAGKHELYKSN